MTVFEAYITNLGKYAEGQLVGETLKFPATTEEVQSLLKNIGVDGVRYEEFFITAFDGDVMLSLIHILETNWILTKLEKCFLRFSISLTTLISFSSQIASIAILGFVV